MNTEWLMPRLCALSAAAAVALAVVYQAGGYYGWDASGGLLCAAVVFAWISHDMCKTARGRRRSQRALRRIQHAINAGAEFYGPPPLYAPDPPYGVTASSFGVTVSGEGFELRAHAARPLARRLRSVDDAGFSVKVPDQAEASVVRDGAA